MNMNDTTYRLDIALGIYGEDVETAIAQIHRLVDECIETSSTDIHTFFVDEVQTIE